MLTHPWTRWLVSNKFNNTAMLTMTKVWLNQHNSARRQTIAECNVNLIPSRLGSGYNNALLGTHVTMKVPNLTLLTPTESSVHLPRRKRITSIYLDYSQVDEEGTNKTFIKSSSSLILFLRNGEAYFFYSEANLHKVHLQHSNSLGSLSSNRQRPITLS